MTTVTSLLRHPRTAMAYVRKADWQPRYRHLAELQPISRVIHAGESHPKMTALVGAGTAAVAAGTVIAMRYQGRPYADVLADEQPYRVSTLDDLRDDEEALALIQRELLAEWGPFGPADMDEMKAMLRNAGRLVFVIRFYEDGELGPPSGVLQTGLVRAGGEPDRLRSAFASFDDITAHGTWEAAPRMHGDTAVLLQITAFGDRSKGIGGRLRDTALYMLPAHVKYALTTTPVPSGFDLTADPESQPATKFHFRGGARPAGYAPGFKVASEGRPGSPAGRQANTDVVFMRYSRNEDGMWEGVKRPDIKLRRHVIELPLRLRRQRATRRGPETLAA